MLTLILRMVDVLVEIHRGGADRGSDWGHGSVADAPKGNGRHPAVVIVHRREVPEAVQLRRGDVHRVHGLQAVLPDDGHPDPPDIHVPWQLKGFIEPPEKRLQLYNA